MTSIDEVINRSREPGEFTERRQFTIARGRAIQKLRKFALVDPHYYILELIQSAVANGATYIDIRCDGDSTALSYIGGSYPESALAQLFDFLFAGEDDVEHGSLRQLALGVNALMLCEPDEIVIETGDGTMRGTTRAVIRGDDDIVEIGRPDAALNGTFLRATGLRRRGINRRSQLKEIDGHPREYHAVESRCLVAPVPILFNHHPIFGYSRQRTPKRLFGFGKTITFDEGDFYGAIGVAHQHTGAVFRLLTHGVWIESTRYEFQGKGNKTIANIGGVITCDRLHKTADHSAIVEDERYLEMWLRLRPYVNQLVSGQVGDASYDVRTLSGDRVENRELLDLLRESDSIVVAPVEAISRDAYFEAATRIGGSLDIPVICVPDKSRDSLKALGGREIVFVIPDLDDERELRFYTQPEAVEPQKPWLISSVEFGTASLLDILEHTPLPEGVSLKRLGDGTRTETTDGVAIETLKKAAWFLDETPRFKDLPEDWKREHLDWRGECIRSRIYTPLERSDERANQNVEVRAAGRLVWSGRVESIASGQVLVVEVSDIAPRLLWSSPKSTEKTRAQWIAEGIVAGHLSEVEAAASQALRAGLRTEFKPGSNAARLILESLSHRVVKRIRAHDGHRRVTFSIVDAELDVDVLDVPVLKSLSGADISLRGMEDLMERCHGLLYAVRADIDADLQGLDKGRIIIVDEVLERILISLVGPTAFVRVDERDVLATFENAQIRDIAVGLREVPDFPFLVEGADPRDWSTDQKRACVESLGGQLMEIIEGEANNADEQELRRQAWRHLQWFAVHRRDYAFADSMGMQVDELPLFALSESRTCSYATLRSVIDERGQVEMLDGWAVGAGELALSDATAREISRPSQSAPLLMTMNPFVLRLLHGAISGVAEYHLSQHEVDALDEPDVGVDAMIERLVIDDDNARGVIGVPRAPVERPAVVVFGTDERDVVVRHDIGRACGIVGKIRLRRGVSHEDAERQISRFALDVLAHLLARLPALYAGDDDIAYDRAVETLLSYAANRVQLSAGMDNTVSIDVPDALSRQILNAPIFAGVDGLPISAMAVYRDFMDQAQTAIGHGVDIDFQSGMIDSARLSPGLTRWLDSAMRSELIHRSLRVNQSAVDPAVFGGDTAVSGSIESTLEYWLNAFHPRTDDENPLHFRVIVDSAANFRFYGDMADDFGQILLVDGSREQPRFIINSNHWIYRWIESEGEQSARSIAWGILAAFAIINNGLHWIGNIEESVCQRRVAEALEDGRLTMIDVPMPSVQ